MKTAKNQVKGAAKQPRQFYTMDELKEFISGKSKVKLLEHVDFKQTDGYSCKFIFEGGFYIHGYRPHNPELDMGGPYINVSLYDILYKDCPRDLVIHYARLWGKVINIFNGFCAFYSEFETYDKAVRRPYDKVVFFLTYNHERSLDNPKEIFTEWREWAEGQSDCEREDCGEWHADSSDAIQVIPSFHLFYDLGVYVYRDGAIYLQHPTQVIRGIPHFAIPSILKFIGACLSQAQLISELKQAHK
ncbi:MAG: hypothetical protein QXF12_01320 [Candidatus Aenigmatarchaeota archaeon]